MNDAKDVIDIIAANCSCDEYIMRKNNVLCAYCDHSPTSHGMFYATFYFWIWMRNTCLTKVLWKVHKWQLLCERLLQQQLPS